MNASATWLDSRWADLSAAATEVSPFTTPAWLQAWAGSFGNPSRSEVAVVTDGAGLPAAAVALARPPRPGGRVASLVGAESADLAPVLVRPDADPQALADLVVGLVPRPGLLLLGRLDPGSGLLAALRASRTTGLGLHCLVPEDFPYLRLGPGGVDETALRRMAKRNDVRRRARRLAEHGEVSVRHEVDPAGTPGFADFLALHDARWHSKDHAAAGLFAAPQGRALLGQVAAGWHTEGALRLSFVLLDERPVAARFGVRLRDTYFGLKSAFDPAQAAFGPGHLMTYEVLAHELATGATRFEFMRGAGDHKSAWTAEAREVGLWVLSRGLPAPLARSAARAALWRRHRARAA